MYLFIAVMKIRRGMQKSGIVVIFIEMRPAQQYAFLLFNKFSDMYFLRIRVSFTQEKVSLLRAIQVEIKLYINRSKKIMKIPHVK